MTLWCLMNSLVRLTLLVAPLVFPLAGCGQAKGPAPAPAGLKAILNQDYVGKGNKRQMLDLYVPEAVAEKPRPLVVYIHGGGWKNGSKEDAGPLFGFLRDGVYAGASVNYRLTDQASWPAQIHDCKAAIRWLRAHAREHNIDPEKIAVFGISAGGHLVSMLGVTGGEQEMEGTLGAHTDQSSRVTCVLDFCGPANFLTMASQGSEIDPDDPESAVAKLMGGPLKDHQDTGRNASPVNHVTRDDAPFLIIHGDKDPLVPHAQAKEMDAALEAAKIPSTLLTGTGGKHLFASPELAIRMRNFVDRHLLGKEVEVAEGPVPAR